MVSSDSTIIVSERPMHRTENIAITQLMLGKSNKIVPTYKDDVISDCFHGNLARDTLFCQAGLVKDSSNKLMNKIVNKRAAH